MKKALIMTVLGFTLTGKIFAGGIPIPVCYPCEELETVEELPSDSLLIGDDGGKLNVGYKYSWYGLLWTSLWNTGGEYCLVNEAEDTYYDLTTDEIKALEEEFDLDLSGSPLSIWTKLGGKAIILAILGWFLYDRFKPAKKKEQFFGGEKSN